MLKDNYVKQKRAEIEAVVKEALSKRIVSKDAQGSPTQDAVLSSDRAMVTRRVVPTMETGVKNPVASQKFGTVLEDIVYTDTTMTKVNLLFKTKSNVESENIPCSESVAVNTVVVYYMEGDDVCWPTESGKSCSCTSYDN